MGSYQNPIGPPDPFDKYRVEGAGEKQTKGDQTEGEEEPSEKNGSGIGAYLILHLQKAVDFFLERYSTFRMNKPSSQSNLILLKNCLEALKLEDRSEDINFLNELAKVWNIALEDSFQLDQDQASEKFKEFANQILHYPENQTHTFGYYLTEYAGQKWVPFPYMELVAKIHFEHEKNPSSSPLTEWTRLLDEVIQILKEN